MNIKETLSKAFLLTKKIDGNIINLLYEPIRLCNRDYKVFTLYNVKRDNKTLYKECLDIQNIRELQEKSKSKYSDIKLEFLK